LEQVPTIAALRQRLEDIRQRELERSLGGSLRDLSEKQKEALEDMTTAMMNKILHAPMSHLKFDSKDEDEKTLYIAALKKLFDLER
jgi:glutamyl-tRNA reductase